MQIKIEIDVRPEELRRFLGLPDVSGLQEDIVAFLRDKIGAAGEFDAGQFVRNNLDTLRKIPAWQKLAAKIGISVEDVQEQAPPPAAAPRKKPRRRKPARTATPESASDV